MTQCKLLQWNLVQ